MSWQAASFALLALVLLGGFAWYERSRPRSQVVALVAALAALAVAGRLVLAPIPNVVATTDIVLIAGYAIGGAPGFAVGALAALVSNFWLGQGPWTPWQMAGWGLVGIGGAALAAATGRRLSRFGLAAACGVAGLAFGALMDLSIMATYGGEQSLDRYLALSARGVPFNIAHALGNIALALAAGPALVRMLVRFRERFEVRWIDARARPSPSFAALSLLAAVAILAGAVSAPQGADARGAGSAVSWLARVQNGDGGFGPSPGRSSGPAMTGWVALGLESAGRSPASFCAGSHSALAYLRSHVKTGTGDLERTILAAAGAGTNPRSFGGRDLVARLRSRRSGNGSFHGQVNLTAFGIMALRAAGSTAGNGESAAWLRAAQNDDGGWGFNPDALSDADSTGAALQALRAAGASGSASQQGVSYLRSVQRPDGGFPLRGSSSNSQSTAWATQGLVAAGINPAGVRSGGRSPLDYLRARQAGDGHYRYSVSSDQTPVWVTAQALAAVNRRAFPVPPVRGGGCPPRARKAAAARARAKREAAKRAAERRREAAARASEEASEASAAEALQPTTVPAGGGPTGEEVLGGALTAVAGAAGAGLLWWRRRNGGPPLWPPRLP